MTISIHGKDYVPVADRVKELHADPDNKTISITTEVINHPVNIIVKATVVIHKGTFTGISAANPSKAIEKMSPYEVAETSAVGRALGFAGYGLVDSIASADEMIGTYGLEGIDAAKDGGAPIEINPNLGICAKCGAPNKTYSTGKVGCSNYCWRTK